ncbi:hypothetical protein F3K43_04875 [Streptomyces sp. LBUM 1476]|nr:hypothetical protein [Streptomyces sp. LBUM 1476]
MRHPDFDLNDNTGRTSNQVNAHRTGSATSDDLRRWARRDADRFRADHPLTEPFPTPDLDPYRAALAEAGSPAEFSYVLDTLLEAVTPAVHEIVNHLEEHFYRWKKHNGGGELDSPARLIRDAASRLLFGLTLADDAHLQALRAHYDPLSSPVPSADTPATPKPPAPPPAPGTAGPRR